MVFKIFLLYWAFASVYSAGFVSKHWDSLLNDDRLSYFPIEIIKLSAFIGCILIGGFWLPIRLWLHLQLKVLLAQSAIRFKLRMFFQHRFKKFLIWLGILKKPDPNKWKKEVVSSIFDAIIEVSKQAKHYETKE